MKSAKEVKVININIGIYYQSSSGYSVHVGKEKYEWYPVNWKELIQVVIPGLFEQRLIAPSKPCKSRKNKGGNFENIKHDQNGNTGTGNIPVQTLQERVCTSRVLCANE